MTPFRDEDISDRYIGWLNDPDVNRFLEVRFVHQTYDTVREHVSGFYNGQPSYMWGVYPKDKEDPIGTATLQNVDKSQGTGQTGLMIGEKEYWGQGAAAEAQNLVMRFAFETLSLRRLTAGADARHHAANFNLKRLGFTCEAKLREEHVLAPGVFYNWFRWGISAEIWRPRRELNP